MCDRRQADGRGRRKTDTNAGSTTTYAWDAESRLTSLARPGVTTSSFGYNGLDARVSKTDSTVTFSFKRNGAGVTDPVLSDGAATYTPGISERRGGSSKFLHSGMKNADAQSGASANVDSSRTYDAFGNLTGSVGTWSGPFGYAGGFGYQEDPDHGLRLLGHRYYDSSTGRFISKDPIGDGRNWYGYCEGNPVRQVDPTGLMAFIPVVVWAAGAALTAWGVYDFLRNPTVVNLISIVPWGKALKAGKGAAEFLMKVLRARKLPEKYVGMITDAAVGWKSGRVNFGIRGSATRQEADELGQIFVGPGYVDKGSYLESADGLRIYRKPSHKPGRNETQANFVTQEHQYDKNGKLMKRKKVVGNGHLTILP